MIIIECNKLAQKEYKTRHDWVEKIILLELCKEIKIRLFYQKVHTQARIFPRK